MHPIYPFIRFARGCFFLYAENAISLRINKLERVITVITATRMKGRYVARAFFPLNCGSFEDGTEQRLFFQRDFSPLLNYREMTFSRNGSFNPAKIGRKGETDRGFFPNKLHERPIERALSSGKRNVEKVGCDGRTLLFFSTIRPWSTRDTLLLGALETATKRRRRRWRMDSKRKGRLERRGLETRRIERSWRAYNFLKSRRGRRIYQPFPLSNYSPLKIQTGISPQSESGSLFPSVHG